MGAVCSRCGALKVNDRITSGRGNNSSSNSSSSNPWRIFTYKELSSATNGFSDDNKLGEGGFGSVYWGKTSDGLQIAVKKLKSLSTKAEMEFAVEVEVLGRVRHKNLLGLKGYCADADQRLIVYDYMPNLSLTSHLHGQFADEVHLDWKRRINIALGAAEGLLYLHHEVTPHIIHRDIKASNVLLDSDFEPLVADFGFAKMIPDGVSHLTTRVKGTLGYLAPEYAMWGKVSESCDVYSYGILLMELVTGRKPIQKLAGDGKRTITEWAEPLITKGRYRELGDPRLRGNFDKNQLKHFVNVAALCVQYEPDKRPTMKEVVELLKGYEPNEMGNQMRVGSVKSEDGLMESDEKEGSSHNKSSASGVSEPTDQYQMMRNSSKSRSRKNSEPTDHGEMMEETYKQYESRKKFEPTDQGQMMQNTYRLYGSRKKPEPTDQEQMMQETYKQYGSRKLPEPRNQGQMVQDPYKEHGSRTTSEPMDQGQMMQAPYKQFGSRKTSEPMDQGPMDQGQMMQAPYKQSGRRKTSEPMDQGQMMQDTYKQYGSRKKSDPMDQEQMMQNTYKQYESRRKSK